MKRGRRFISVLSTITLSLSLFIIPVKAESDIYYPPEYSYSAYQYFFNNGYSNLMLTTSDSVTYNVNLDNYGTNNGSITGTDAMTGSSHTTGTINSNNSSLGSKYLTCTTNNAVSGTQTYSCYFSSSSSSVSNSQTINIKLNENTYSDYSNVDIGVNESINQTINTDITGSISATNSTVHYSRLPWLKGTYIHSSKYTSGKLVHLDSNTSDSAVYIMFYTNSDITHDVTIYDAPSFSGHYSYSYKSIPNGWLFLNILYIYCDQGQGNISVDFYGLNNEDVMPLYLGNFNSMPDNVAMLGGLRKSTNELLQNGDDNTSGKVNNANTVNNQMSNKINQFDSIENNSVTDMNTNIQNLNITPDILSNSKFLSSAQWVKTQFDRMTINTPVGSVLSFSLILGITLIFLGKIR